MTDEPTRKLGDEVITPADLADPERRLPTIHRCRDTRILRSQNQLFYTDREARVAFGTAYPRKAPDGTMGFEPRYQVGIFFPHETAKNLYVVLRAMLKNTNQLPPDEDDVPPVQH